MQKGKAIPPGKIMPLDKQMTDLINTLPPATTTSKGGILMEDGSEAFTGAEKKPMWEPRVWIIDGMEKAMVAFNTRDNLVDSKLAANVLYGHIQRGIPRHYDEVLAEVRQPKNIVVFYVKLHDEITGKKIDIELSNITEDGVKEFVAGLNEFEAALVAAELTKAPAQ